MDEKPLKILVIAPTPFFSDRGCHIRINEESRAVIARGHTLKILTYGLGKDLPGLDIERIHYFSFYKKTSAGPSFFKLVLDALLMLKTARAIRTFKPDVIHAHLHEGVCIAWAARFLTWSRVPILFDAQGSLVAELRNFLKAPRLFFAFMDLIERWIFHVSQSVVVSSDSLLKVIRTKHLASESKHIVLAADSANPVPVSSDAEKAALRSVYGIPHDALTLVYCGGMTADKGTELLYEALLPLMRANTRAHMVWIGGPERAIQNQAIADGVADRMRFLGSQPFAATHRLSQLGDIAIDPKPPASSQASGKMLNYMAIQLPIITFDSDNRDMIDPSNFFASPATVDGLRAALERAIKTPREQLVTIGQKNTTYLDTHFSWRATAKVLEDVYNEMRSRKA